MVCKFYKAYVNMSDIKYLMTRVSRWSTSLLLAECVYWVKKGAVFGKLRWNKNIKINYYFNNSKRGRLPAFKWVKANYARQATLLNTSTGLCFQLGSEWIINVLGWIYFLIFFCLPKPSYDFQNYDVSLFFVFLESKCDQVYAKLK